MPSVPDFSTLQERLARDPLGPLAVPSGPHTPFVVVDLPRMERNLRAMAEYARGRDVMLRPHAKTHRTAEVAHRQIAAGATGLCVAKLSEAGAFVRQGINDILVAYPLVGHENVVRAVQLADRSTARFCSDNSAAVRRMSAQLAERGDELELLVIVDTGMNRDGLAPDAAADLAREVDASPALRFGGLLTHEGHAYRQTSAADLRRVAINAGETIAGIARDLADSGVPVPTVSVGSTATARITPEVDGVTEMRPGGYAFYDYGQVLLGTSELKDCAVRIVTTVISANEAGRALIDAGSNTLGRDPVFSFTPPGGPSLGLLVGLPGWNLHAASEEHGWLRWEGSGPPPTLSVGQRLQVLPNHICSTFHNAGRSFAVEDGHLSEEWHAVARGCSW